MTVSLTLRCLDCDVELKRIAQHEELSRLLEGPLYVPGYTPYHLAPPDVTRVLLIAAMPEGPHSRYPWLVEQLSTR